MAYDNRDDIDLGKVEVHKLFGKIFIPTLLGMLFNVAFILVDGIFVGNGVGPSGVAGINLAAPVMMLITGIGMMFGIGSSVVAAIHLSKDNVKAARINVTQGFIASLAFAAVVAAVLYSFPSGALKLLGTSPELMPMTREYLVWFIPTCVLVMFQIVGEFAIRLDGSPKYAMYCAIVPAVLNIIFDYIFIFLCHLGLKGAALATDIGTFAGAMMTLFYFFRPAKTLRFYHLKASATSLRLTLRNVGYMMKVGVSGFIGEFSFSVMMLCGNLAFGRLLGDDGIAAFGVICYLTPVVSNVFYAVSSSAQPIISFNYGADQHERVNGTFRFSVGIAVGFAVCVTLIMCLFSSKIVSVFLDSATTSFGYAAFGLPLFSLSFALNGFNVSAIGYFQSVEDNLRSTLLMALRGIILPIAAFIVLPDLFAEYGLWLAMPVAEFIALVVAVAMLRRTPLR